MKKFLILLFLFCAIGYCVFPLVGWALFAQPVDFAKPENAFGILVGALAAVRWYLTGLPKFKWRRDLLSGERRETTAAWLEQAKADGWHMTEETVQECPDDGSTDR